jgi:hypothetical protein
MEFEEFEKEYVKKAKKFSLPEFKKLEEDFEVSKAETDDLVLRAVRKAMMERVISTLGFFEMLLNPMNAPRMYHKFLSSLTVGDTKKIEEMYGSLAGLSIKSLEREVDYSEKGEAEMVKEVSEIWDKIRPGFRDILRKMKNPGNGGNGAGRKEKSYYG